MKALRILLCVWATLGVLAAAQAQGDPNCGLESRLHVGDNAAVTPGDANNVRDAAGRGGARVGELAGGAAFTVTQEAVCADGFTWIGVTSFPPHAPVSGWTVEASADEYFVEPLPPGLYLGGEGISLVLPEAAGSEGEIVVVEPEYSSTDPDTVRYPGYRALALPAFLASGEATRYTPLRVYAADAFDGLINMLGEEGAYTVEELGRILADLPDLAGFDVIGNRLPDFAPGVAAGMYAYLDYLDFANGSGYRFITYYAQDFIGPPEVLAYRYVGLTSDGDYFVTLSLSVRPPELPAAYDPSTEDPDDPFSAFLAYSRETAAFFDALAPERYTPDLRELDALVASLLVEPVQDGE